MSNVVEIRWHGRGGQGTKTASELLAAAAFNTGKYVQGFPEYGPERMGAPMAAFNRIADERIRVHSNIYEPDYVVVVDESLIEVVDVTAGLKEGGALIVNTAKTPEEVKAGIPDYKGKVCTIDARTISEECIGRYFPNTPTLAAVVKVTGVMSDADFIADMEKTVSATFASKPQVIEGNMNALKRAISEVKGL